MAPNSPFRVRAVLAAIGLAVVLPARLAATSDVVITSSLSSGAWIAPTDAIVLQLDRPLAAPGERLALFIDDTDWTSLFVVNGTTARYQSAVFPLPSGEHTLVAYVTQAEVWKEQARFPLKVLTARGFERAATAPAVEIGLAGQVAEWRDPASTAGARTRFQDLRITGGLRSSLRRSGWTTEIGVDLVGVNRHEDALRFAERQQSAPLFDLSGYQLSAANRRVSMSVGQVSMSGHRHLLGNFASRGLAGSVGIGRQVRISGAAYNGSSLVGWNNPIGLSTRDHRVVSGTFGVEWIPARPGGFVTEFTALNGSRLPQSGFTQGAVNDAERSRAFGVRLAGNDAAQRLRLDGGYSRSRFTNPSDPLLSQGLPIVEVIEETRGAQYLDASYAFVQNKMAGRVPVTLVAGLRHERVDPLYRVITAGTRPDISQNALDFTGTLGAATFQVSHLRAHDNLDAIASILTTRTKQTTLSVVIPLGGFRASGANPALPSIGYQGGLTTQRGDGVPINSDFLSPSQIPDQLSANHVVTVDWNLPGWQAGYRVNRSSQDNRQPGRELADLINLVHSVSAQFMPGAAFDVGVELAFERAHNVEFAQRDHTNRIGMQGNWRITKRSLLSGSISTTQLGNEAETRDGRQVEFQVQFAQSLALARRRDGKPSIQVYFRLARQTNRLTDSLFGVADRRRAWTANTGVTLSVF